MRVPRRERSSVLVDVLHALDRHADRYGGDARLTNVATSARVPYDRLQAYLAELTTARLITANGFPRLTERGREFLRQYRAWSEVLDRFGLV